jgi:hypothetical protein
MAHLFGIRVRAETGVENSRSRMPRALVRLEEALGLGEYEDTMPAQVGLEPGGARNRACLKERAKSLLVVGKSGFTVARDRDKNRRLSRLHPVGLITPRQ